MPKLLLAVSLTLLAGCTLHQRNNLARILCENNSERGCSTSDDRDRGGPPHARAIRGN